MVSINNNIIILGRLLVYLRRREAIEEVHAWPWEEEPIESNDEKEEILEERNTKFFLLSGM